jgi:hypothetical protein
MYFVICETKLLHRLTKGILKLSYIIWSDVLVFSQTLTGTSTTITTF